MKILVIRFSSLGDVVLVSPLFQKIKNRYPISEITFLTDNKFECLFKTDPNVDRIISYDVSGENLVYLIKSLKRMRKEHYDIIIDCHSIPRSLIFLYFGRAIKRKRVNKFSLQRRKIISSQKKREIPHVVKRYLATLNGMDRNEFKPNIYLKEEEIDKISNILSKKKGKKKVVGFVPGASKRTKIWKLEKLKSLAVELVDKNDVFIIFFGNKEEIPLVKEVKEGLQNQYLDLSGKTNLRELALFINNCNVLFTTDSGPMHIAVAVGTPVVSIFGPTVPEFGFAPYDEKSVVISKSLSCRPCSLHGNDVCPLRHHNCMKLIEIEEVRKEIERLLANEKTRIKEKGKRKKEKGKRIREFK